MKVWQQDRALFMQNPLFGNQEMDVRDKVAMKKALYMKEGMHIVTTASKAEKGIDRISVTVCAGFRQTVMKPMCNYRKLTRGWRR